jgi:uncharacterized protein (TIGR00369 family)
MKENIKDTQWTSLEGVDSACFGCGTGNPHGLQMKFESNGNRLRSRLIMQPRFRGWSNLVHGGVLSTILDETMSWTVIRLTGKFMLTKGMNIAFKKPVRVGAQLISTGFISEYRDERRVLAVAEIRDESGDLCASSEGEFVLFTKEQFLKMEIMPHEDIDAMVTAIS